MARIKVVERVKPKPKRKTKKEKEIMIVPRLRLEPRLSPKLKETKAENCDVIKTEQSDFVSCNSSEQNDVPKIVSHEKDLNLSADVKQINSEMPIINSGLAKTLCVAIPRCDFNSLGINDNVDSKFSEQTDQKKMIKNSLTKTLNKNENYMSCFKSRLPKLKKNIKANSVQHSNFPKVRETKQNDFYNLSFSDKLAEVSVKEQQNYDARSLLNSGSIDNNVDEEIGQNVSNRNGDRPHTKKIKNSLRVPRDWTNRELLNLATGLQTFGFNEMKKVTEIVKTKNENAVFQFIGKRSSEESTVINSARPNRRGRPINTWNTLNPQHMVIWPNIRKWRRMAYDQILTVTRCNDYSKPVISALCRKFYEEETEPSDPQVINTKLIYKYLADCIAGEIPAQLPPMESALVVDLLKDVKLMPQVYDFEEETQFLENYKGATKYKPFEIKDEFKKRFAKARTGNMFSHNAVSVPEEVFLNLSRHKRLVQCFNPLATPVWMMQKEQEFLEKFI